MVKIVEQHLGGHGNKTWIDEGALLYFVDRFYVRSMLDIGCGVGGMYSIAKKNNVYWVGVDGDPEVDDESVLIHDFTKNSLDIGVKFDLGWSVEFLEHVEEKYMYNYMVLFTECKYVLCTAAIPGTGGYHHVNEQPKEYWINKFGDNGLVYNDEITEKVKEASTMENKSKFGKTWLQRSGMVFINEKFI